MGARFTCQPVTRIQKVISGDPAYSNEPFCAYDSGELRE